MGTPELRVAAPREEEYQFGGHKFSNSMKRWQLGWYIDKFGTIHLQRALYVYLPTNPLT